MLLHVLFRQTALRRDLLDELAVITWNAQSGSHLLADGPAAAAKFAADGDDALLHVDTSIPFLMIVHPARSTAAFIFLADERAKP